MKYIITFLVIIMLSACNNGRPIVSPRLDVIVDADFMLRHKYYSPDRTVVKDDKNGFKGISTNSHKPADLAFCVIANIAVFGLSELIDGTYDESYKNDFNKEVPTLMIKVVTPNRMYVSVAEFGLNRIKMNEEMLQDIKTSFCKIEIEYKDKWSYKETVDMGVIHSPESCLIKFRDDGHVFIDDICVK